MKTLRAYSKSEDAYADAALLCGMGFEAVVIDDHAFGGNLLGSASAVIRIELPDEQVSEAIDLLDRRHSEPLPPSETKVSPIADVSLHKLLRVILCLDLAITILLLVAEDLFVVTPPAQVEEFLLTMHFGGSHT